MPEVKSYKDKVKDLYQWVVKHCKDTGICTLSTCDHPNWDRVEHAAMHNDVSRLLKEAGYNVKFNVKWGVTDWTITRPVTLEEVTA